MNFKRPFEIKEFSKRHLVVIIVCFVFALVCFFSVSGFNLTDLKYSGDSITSDEVPHITSGYYYLKSGRYFLNPEHPPLVKDISALLTRFFLNPDFPKVSADAPYPQESEKEDLFFNKKIFPRVLEIENYHWDNRMLIFNPENNPDLIILLSRLSVIIFNSIFLFILYLLLSKTWGKRSALMGIFFIAVSQFSIAHASLVTTDFMATILSISALALFSVFIKKFFQNEKNLRWMLVSILFFSLSFLTKFSTLTLIPVAFLGGLAYSIIATNNKAKIFSYTERFLTMMILSLLLVFSFYSFHVANSDGEGIRFQLQNNYPSKLPSYGKEFLMKMAEGNRLERAIATYGVGLSMTINRIDSAGQSTYFLGKVYGSEGAGPWYFPTLYLTKLPAPFLATQGLLLLLLIFAIYNLTLKLIKKEVTLQDVFGSRKKISALSILLIIFIAIYARNALNSRLNIGLRHFMPVIMASAILTGRWVSLFWYKKYFKYFKTKPVFLLLSAFLIISVFISFPYYLSYYNIMSGGTNNGYKIATDSNYDWGQDIKRLGKWMAENDVKKIYGDIFSLNAPKYYLGDSYENFNIKNADLPPSGSYLAVSAMNYQNNVYIKDISPDKKYSILKDSLVDRIGKSIFIFKIP